jgi:acetyl-CoA carboxylase biotin carboxyl carrier protein
MDINDIKELIELIENKDIIEIEYSKADEKIRIVRATAEIPKMELKTQQTKSDQISGTVPLNTDERKTYISVNSPFVGTFYCAPSPSEKPFVEIGSKVKKGQTIGIVEAMKLMNAIEADADGVIKQILKKDGDPVEFGEPLFAIDSEG